MKIRVYLGLLILLAICGNLPAQLNISGGSPQTIGAGTTSTLQFGSSSTLTLDAANILALKNGTNAQALRVYGTTSGTQYLNLEHTGNGSYAVVNAVGSNLYVQANSNGWLMTSGSANWVPQGDNAQDVGTNIAGVRAAYLYTLAFTPVAFASLPTGVEGKCAWVNNSTTSTYGATVAGGGANKVLACHNGTNWLVH